jgi:hypothetical protein
LILRKAESRYGALGAAKQGIMQWDALITSSTGLPEREQL